MRSLLAFARTNTVAIAALLVALSSGAYAAGLADNSVRSRHIADAAVREADIATGGVGALEVADDSLTASDIADGSLSGDQVADGSLTGADVSSLSGVDILSNSVLGGDIDESTLGEVPRATIAGHGGYGRHGSVGSCNPGVPAPVTCATVALQTAAPARFLLIGSVDAHGEGYMDCWLGVSTTGRVSGTTNFIDFRSDGRQSKTLLGVTSQYPAGSYSFGVDCVELDGYPEPDSTVTRAQIVAVAISPY